MGLGPPEERQPRKPILRLVRPRCVRGRPLPGEKARRPGQARRRGSHEPRVVAARRGSRIGGNIARRRAARPLMPCLGREPPQHACTNPGAPEQSPRGRDLLWRPLLAQEGPPASCWRWCGNPDVAWHATPGLPRRRAPSTFPVAWLWRQGTSPKSTSESALRQRRLAACQPRGSADQDDAGRGYRRAPGARDPGCRRSPRRARKGGRPEDPYSGCVLVSAPAAG